jgi:hypothetical protein
METTIDKRVCQRHACDLPVVWSYFNQDQCYHAKQLNYSEGGVYLETPSAPRSGATILIKRQYPLAGECNGQTHLGQREITLAEVRWCREAKDSIGCYYRVGASYLSGGFP